MQAAPTFRKLFNLDRNNFFVSQFNCVQFFFVTLKRELNHWMTLPRNSILMIFWFWFPMKFQIGFVLLNKSCTFRWISMWTSIVWGPMSSGSKLEISLKQPHFIWLRNYVLGDGMPYSNSMKFLTFHVDTSVLWRMNPFVAPMIRNKRPNGFQR